MISMNVTTEEAKTMLSMLIERKDAIEDAVSSLEHERSGICAMIHELHDTLTGAETPAPAELAEITWEVNDDRDRLNRINRALKEVSEVNELKDGLFQVLNGKGKIFIVAIEGTQGSCTCMDFQKRGRSRGMPCKHMYAARMHADTKITAADDGKAT